MWHLKEMRTAIVRTYCVISVLKKLPLIIVNIKYEEQGAKRFHVSDR